jgi:squalene cyclase
LNCLGELKCLSWRKIVTDYQNKIYYLKKDLHIIKKKILEGKLSKETDNKKTNAENKYLMFDDNSIIKSISKGIEYIKGQQNKCGSWEDIKLDVGKSTEWVTGYIGYALWDVFEDIGRLKIENLDFLHKAKNWLIQAEHKNGGWGFNEVSGVDADSTSNCIIFLFKIGGLEAIDINKILNIYIENLNLSGVGTYSTEEIKREKARNNINFSIPSLSNYSGWCSSDTQISAITIIALTKLQPNNKINKIIQNALGFIVNTQNSDGYWNSYWSNGKLLGTSCCVEALSITGKENKRITMALEWLSKQQSTKGGWNNGRGAKITGYDTALATMTLMNMFNKFQKEIKQGVKWLLKNQLADGSWKAFPFMTIPTPWDETQINTPKLLEAVADDNRIFTTATILKTLSKFYKLTY